MRAPMELAPIYATPTRTWPRFAQQHVLGNGELAKVSQLLVDGREAGLQGVAWRTEPRLVSSPADRAAVGRVNAAQDFDEGGFAGAVFADHSQHFTGVQFQRERFQRLDTRKRLFDSVQLQQRRSHGSSGLLRMLLQHGGGTLTNEQRRVDEKLI